MVFKKKQATIVIFGGTGDLTARKLVPALTALIHAGTLAKGSTIVGVSRKKMSNEEYKSFLKKHIIEEKERAHFDSVNVQYVQADLSKIEDIQNLDKVLRMCRIDGCNRLYYFATGFKFFSSIVKGLKRYNLHKSKKGFTRVIFEKPFGENLLSSNKLDKNIHSVFSEKDVFRIDHYLAKESVRNLQILKSNKKLWHLLLDTCIERIEVVVDEYIGVGNRIEYYDSAGAIKDMVQNHLLQVLALTLIDPKKELHSEKQKILNALRFIPEGKNLLGQYKTYAQELKEARMSKSFTETFARLELACDTNRWKNVRLFVRTGKKLARRRGKIRIIFKKNMPLQRIILSIYPNQKIKIFGKDKKIKQSLRKDLNKCTSCNFSPNTVDEYKVLLAEALQGTKELFTRDEEIKRSWEIVETILKHKKKIPFVVYPNCTDPEKQPKGYKSTAYI